MPILRLTGRPGQSTVASLTTLQIDYPPGPRGRASACVSICTLEALWEAPWEAPLDDGGDGDLRNIHLDLSPDLEVAEDDRYLFS